MANKALLLTQPVPPVHALFWVCILDRKHGATHFLAVLNNLEAPAAAKLGKAGCYLVGFHRMCLGFSRWPTTAGIRSARSCAVLIPGRLSARAAAGSRPARARNWRFRSGWECSCVSSFIVYLAGATSKSGNYAHQRPPSPPPLCETTHPGNTRP